MKSTVMLLVMLLLLLLVAIYLVAYKEQMWLIIGGDWLSPWHVIDSIRRGIWSQLLQCAILSQLRDALNGVYTTLRYVVSRWVMYAVKWLTDSTGDVNTRSVPTLHGFTVERLCKLSVADHSCADRDHDKRQITLWHWRQVI